MGRKRLMRSSIIILVALFIGINTVCAASAMESPISSITPVNNLNKSSSVLGLLNHSVVYNGNGSTGGSVPIDNSIDYNGATVIVLGTLAQPKPVALALVAPKLGVAVPVLYYHLVDDNLWSPFHSMFMSPSDFANQMKYLKTAGYTVIPLAQIENAGQYTKPVIITFDDGYEDNYTNAYPVLKEYNFPATVFLISSFIGRTHYLTGQEILQMRDLVSFQDHTVTHRSLATLSPAVQENELSASKQVIEALTGQKVFAAAYPDGSYDQTTIEIAKQLGYKYAFLMVPGGIYYTGENPYIIKRINVVRGMDMNDFIDKLDGLST